MIDMHHMRNTPVRVLIVDDNKANIQLLIQALRDDYKLSVATGGRQAIDLARAQQPDIILLDVMMPGIDGYETCENLQRDPATAHIPVIFLTALTKPEEKARAFETGAVDFVTKPVEILELQARVRTHLSLRAAQTQLRMHNERLEDLVDRRTRQLHDSQMELIQRLSIAAEFKDNETGEHIIRMSHYCRMVAEEYGLDARICEMIHATSPMHDVGKIGIPDHILLKPGKLDADEWQTMKTHTTIGGKILSGGENNALMRMARTIAMTHHEKFDGNGYPHGLSGKDIPIEGRIVGLCDVFDALTSDRPYKKAWTVEAAVDEIRNSSGSHFDPDVVECFLTILPKVSAVKEEYGCPLREVEAVVDPRCAREDRSGG